MRKKLFVVFCAFLAPVFSAAQSHDPFEADTTEFVLTVGSLSTKAMDAYPQRITGLSKDGKGYRVVLTVVNPYADSARRAKMMEAPYSRNRSYDGETAKYLLSTPLIDPENELLAGIADTLFTDESSAFAVINKALSFTHGFLSPDDSLARRIDAGTCRTLDVASIIERRRGTCSEYANLFIALMRRKNIPARLAVGYVYAPEYKAVGSHAWPECYLDGIGWFAVDPTMNTFWFPHFMMVKMRDGVDYEDCDIGLLKEDIEPVEIAKK